MEEIGQKIRALRRERGFTLKQLASLANCSPSFISQVERGKASPSIATLKQIASALKVNIVDFFLSSDGFEPVVMPRDERVEITLPRWKAKIYLLVRDTKGKKIQPFYTIIEPGGGSRGLYSHEGEEFGLVLRGELEINLNGVRHRVKEGESFYYSSTIPHSWSNPTDQETVVVWVVSPPTW